MNKDDAKLLPCPFCGGTDAFVERLDYTASYVHCDSDVGHGCACMARGPISVQDDDGEEQPGKAGAIAAWNLRATAHIEQGEAVALTVWYGSMPESNGKSNFTAVLMRKGAEWMDGMTDGHTIDVSEYPDRVRYEADRVRWLIGELAEKPDMLAYDADKHSGYTAPVEAQPVASAGPSQGDYRQDPTDERFNALTVHIDARSQPTAASVLLTDAQINEITMGRLGKWPSFEAQSWACKVVHAVAAAAPQPPAAQELETVRMHAQLLNAKLIQERIKLVPYDPAKWVLIHNGQTAQGDKLSDVIRLGHKMRTKVEQLLAHENLARAIRADLDEPEPVTLTDADIDEIWNTTMFSLGGIRYAFARAIIAKVTT